MPRFSSQGKKIFDLIYYNGDIQSANKLIDELTSPFDKCFAEFSCAFYYVSFYNRDSTLEKIRELEKFNKSNPDIIFLYFIKMGYFFYYIGFNNNPVISFELATKYYHELEGIFPQIDFYDDWERYFFIGFHYRNQGMYFWIIENNISKGIEFHKKSKEIFSLVPDDGVYLSKGLANNNLGAIQRLGGDFSESEKNLLTAMEELQKYDSRWQVFPLSNLLKIYFQKGEIQKAIELNNQILKISKKFNDIYLIYRNLEMQGDLFYEEGNNEKALESYQESLNFRKKYIDKLELFKGYGKIFNFYYQTFKITKDKYLFQKADEILSECTKLYEQYPDDQTIKNYTKFYQACMFKYGNFSKRAKAGEIFEYLIKFDPNTWSFVVEYLELLFEDYIVSEELETLNKIDLLITKIYNIPLNINSIDSFVYQQILLSKYHYYIKNNINYAIELLNKAKNIILPYQLGFLNSKLDINLEMFKQEREKWDKIDFSVKERIEKSEFDKYIQDALKMKIL